MIRSVEIKAPEIGIRELYLKEEAVEAVRLNHNNSNIGRVDRLKLLAAAFISECMDGVSSREFAVAVTEMQTACMWGVLAAVKEHESGANVPAQPTEE